VTSYEVAITNPAGALLYQAWCYSSPCLVALTNAFAQSGSYTVTVTPGGAATMSFTATLAPTVTGTLTSGTPYNLNLSSPWQGASLTFVATAGETTALDVSAITSTPADESYSITIYNSAGASVGGTNSASSTTINLPNLAAGTYRVSVASVNSPSTATMQLTLEPGVADALPLAGSGVNIRTSAPGQDAYFTFPGTFGQSLSLAISNFVQTPSSVGEGTLSASYPGGPGHSVNCGSSGCVLHLPTLTQTATYTAVLSPGGAATLTATATLTPDVTGALVLGTPFNVSLSETGQSASLTFQVTSDGGMTLALYLANLSATPAGTAYTVSVTNFTQGGTAVASTSFTGNATFNLPSLPAGTYTVVITPNAPAVATLQITLEPQTGGTLAMTGSGSGSTFTTPAPGQDAYFSFTATAGENLSLALSGLSLTPSSVTSAYVTVTGPSSYSTSAYCYTSNGGCEVPLKNLPTTGTYNVTVTPEGAATMSFAATLSANVTGALATSSPQNLSLAATGEEASLTFTATAGETVALYIGGITSTPTNTSYTVTVYNSAGTSVASGSGTTGTTLNLPNLAAGTYSVMITSTAPATATMQATLEPQTGGTLSPTSSGSGSTFTTPAPTQNAYFTFTATAGESLSLALTGFSLTPSSVTTAYVSVTGPSSYSTSAYCYGSTGSCELPLRNLPAAGTYTATVTPEGAATMTFTATLSADVTGTLTAGTAQSVPLAAMGQAAWLSFTATAGQTFALYVSGITSTPANTSYAVTVYNSAGTSVASGSGTTGTTLNLPSLAAGTYNVLIASATPSTATMQATLEPQTGGTLSPTSSGSGSSYTTPAPSQDAYFTFTAAAGESLSLALSALSLTPSSVTYAYVTVSGPSSYSNSAYCYASNGGCEIPLKNLAVGTYNVTVSPGGTATMSFTATLSADVTGTLAASTPQSLPLAALGQGAWLSFTATASQTLALDVSGVTSTPANTSYTVTVYNSSGTSVASASSATGTTLNLPNLAAGTYNVLITPAAPATATMQATLEPQTGGALSTTSSGSGSAFTTPAPSQNAYFTFTATAGESLSLALSGLSLTPSSVTSAYVSVTGPGSYSTSLYCYTSYGGCEIPLKNLAAGTYSVTVTPSGAATMSFTATLSADVTDALTASTPQSLTLAATGQGAWLNFTITSTQTVTVTVSSISSTPASTSYTMTVYSSSGTSEASGSTTTGTTLTMTNLAAGTYNVLVTPQYPATASMQVSYQ
jgi:trimeric autotransporter adhesin